MAEVKVGNWWTMCCQKDLEQITEDEVEHINQLIADDWGVDIYESKLQALLEIRESWVLSKERHRETDPSDYDSEIVECDRMIEELRSADDPERN